MDFRRMLAMPVAVCSLGLVLGVGGFGDRAVSAAVNGGPVLALTGTNTIVGFDAASPGTLTQTTTITGLAAGEVIVGFDIRPATGELLAMGVNGTTGRLYTLNSTTGVATPVGMAAFSTTLPAGGTWSVDVNPVVDRIRVVHSSGVSLRVNPLDGTLVATDTTIAPAKPSAVAYDRSTSNPAPTATTLFAIDEVTDTLNLVGGLNGTPSPNAGATTQVGALGVDVGTSSVGFDIAPQGDALATFSVGGSYGLYGINLTTGAATLVGAIDSGTLEVRDIALPRPPVGPMLALTTGNELLAFDAASPGTTTSKAITGLQTNEKIVGIDVRPATGEVIGVGLVGTSGRVYRIDPASGAATQLGTTPFTVTAIAPAWSVDFNPTVDRIRLTNTLGDSYRLNPLNGTLAGTDTDIAPAKPSAVAYDRPVATTAATTLYAIDDVADTLNIIGGPDGTPSPNTGVTTARGPLGVATDSELVGFDISAIGEGVAALSTGGNTGLYTVDLASGGARLIGLVGDGTPDILDVAFVAKFAAGGSQFTPVAATRLLDTRNGAKPAAGTTIDLQVTGVAGVPANATAIVINTTATQAGDEGFVTVFPAGEPRPVVSNLNLVVGQTRANLVTVKIGALGKVSMFTYIPTHLLADVVGYYAPPTGTAGRFTALSPSRLVDTRKTVAAAPNSTLTVPVLGKGGVPATGVSSVLVNIAGVEAVEAGFITAYATGTTRPGTSNVNLQAANSTASNLAIVPVGTDGSITIYSDKGSHILVDVAGWYGDATAKGGFSGLFVGVSPVRVVDTRNAIGAPKAPLAPNTSIDVSLGGFGGIPATGASSALVNVTSVDAPQPGFINVYPTGQPLAEVSSLNVDIAKQVTPNLVGATLGAGGKVTVLDDAGGHLLMDVFGWFTV